MIDLVLVFFFFSSRRRHTRCSRDWSSDVCSSDLAGDEGVTVFLQQLLASFEGWWAQLPTWHKLEPEQQRALIQSIERAYRGKIPELREARDRRLSAILRALEQSRTT